MKREYYLSFIALVLVFSACNQEKNESHDSLMGVQSVLWSQFSAEAEALYLQGYNMASRVMKDSAGLVHEKPWAVVLDIDETVLDNSPFNVEMLRAKANYSEEIWGEWCEMREAISIPGAHDFTLLAAELGISVFYVSNRKDHLLGATLENLNELGFPFADSSHVLLKKDTSSKDARRATVMEHHKILLFVGDNLGDFDGVFDERSDEYGKATVRQLKDLFGSRFIMLPNPMYGSWERAVFSEGMPGDAEVLDKLRGY